MNTRSGQVARSGLALVVLSSIVTASPPVRAQGPEKPQTRPERTDTAALDGRVRAFLEGARRSWRDLNVPYEDGQVLHDLVVKKGFTRGLEIGTSTGHSAIWIAWAMSKTGGRLVTIEVDEGRYRTALRNFESAGIAPWVDARLGDAHRLVPELPGPFDFVFSDADKDWYVQYFNDLDGKLAAGGCFTAHNVLDGFAGIADFLDAVRARPNYVTTIDRTSRSGISVSCKAR